MSIKKPKIKHKEVFMERHAADHGNEVFFLKTRAVVFDRVRGHIERWIREQGIYFFDVFCEREESGAGADGFCYTVRVIDRYQRRAHLFRLRFRNGSFELGYLRMSQNPALLRPAGFRMELQQHAGSFC